MRVLGWVGVVKEDVAGRRGGVRILGSASLEHMNVAMVITNP